LLPDLLQEITVQSRVRAKTKVHCVIIAGIDSLDKDTPDQSKQEKTMGDF